MTAVEHRRRPCVRNVVENPGYTSSAHSCPDRSLVSGNNNEICRNFSSFVLTKNNNNNKISDLLNTRFLATFTWSYTSRKRTVLDACTILKNIEFTLIVRVFVVSLFLTRYIKRRVRPARYWINDGRRCTRRRRFTTVVSS